MAYREFECCYTPTDSEICDAATHTGVAWDPRAYDRWLVARDKAVRDRTVHDMVAALGDQPTALTQPHVQHLVNGDPNA